MRFFSSFTVTSFLLKVVVAECGRYPNFNADVKATSDRLKGNYSALRLANGLDVIIHFHDNDTLPLLDASLTVGVGASQVSKKNPILKQPIPGLAHLVEHCISYASSAYPNPHESNNYLNSNYGSFNAATVMYKTYYGITVSHYSRIVESLRRFAYMFVSPIFTPEIVKAQSLIINNEWVKDAHQPVRIGFRLPQLLMSKDQPSELFLCGNEDSLSSATAEQVELFWRTHYTADNIKLAISVNQRLSAFVERAIVDFFSLIPSSNNESSSVNMHPTVDFWSPALKDQHLKVYTKNSRRNYLHLYWHFHCNDEAHCADSVYMAALSVNYSLWNRFSKKDFYVEYVQYSYDEFMLGLSFQIRDKELSSVSRLKNEVINLIKSDAENVQFNENSPTFSEPSNLAECLSSAMMFSANLVEAPLRAHFKYVYSNETDELRKAHLNVISNENTRMIVSYKSSTLKKIKTTETLLKDPYFFIYYQFEKNDKLPAMPIPEYINPPNFSIHLKIDIPVSSYPSKFLIGVFVEILLIQLKSKKIYYTHAIDDSSIQIKVYLENINSWDPVMGELIQSFSSLKTSSKVFEKAKKRWLLEIKNTTSSLLLNSIATEYAGQITSNNLLTESSLLISDPNPENVIFKEVANVGRIIQTIGTLTVNSYGFPPLYESDIRNKLGEMWTTGKTLPNYTFSYIQPAKDETFIYVPSHISTADSGVMMIFNLADKFLSHSAILEEILRWFLYKRLCFELNLVYYSEVNSIADKYIYIITPSFQTPEKLQNTTLSLLEEMPDYIRGISDSNWRVMVGWNEVSKESVIDTVQKYFIENGAGRLIIQLWGRNKRAARKDYLDRMSLLPAPCPKFILSIKDYPRTGVIPEYLCVDYSTPDTFEDDTSQSEHEKVKQELITDLDKSKDSLSGSSGGSTSGSNGSSSSGSSSGGSSSGSGRSSSSGSSSGGSKSNHSTKSTSVSSPSKTTIDKTNSVASRPIYKSPIFVAGSVVTLITVTVIAAVLVAKMGR